MAMQRHLTRPSLSDVLVREGILTRRTVDQVVARLGGSTAVLGQTLVEEGTISEAELAQALASQFGLPYDQLTGFRVDPEFYHTISVKLMRRHPFVPLKDEAGVLTIAISDPQNLLALDELEILLNRPLHYVVSSKSAIQAALERSEGSSQALRELEAEYRSVLVKEDERGEEVLTVDHFGEDQSPVVKLLDTIMLSAMQRRASDIHIEATDRATTVKFRVDGILVSAMDPLDVKLHPPLVSRLKVMSDLDIAERRVPQDGSFRMRLDRKTVDFRVSILPSVFGESVVIRILDREAITTGVSTLRLDRLGFNPEDLKRFRRAITRPYGMVLVTGPTGSGKTTTLYAAISEMNIQEDKLITIEDPVEYQLPGVVQIPVNEKKGLTFARGLRSILRHDPDKIMVGEIRDAETAQIAIQSALTGHLVLTTVHANNVFDVIGRFASMGIDSYNFLAALTCVLAQRLIRVICPDCRHPVPLDQALAEESGLDYDEFKGAPFYEGKGCSECHETGYRGRKCITEFLDLTDEIKEMILADRALSEIRYRAVTDGMITLRQSAVKKVLAGETTLREINRVTFSEER
ncbi:MAG: ATPase, T2SS/T4P/T4SS family [Nitrospira sp.]|jgi:type IV pilus assembly protein PilB|nr:Flp pilus assembly complex ATPase component TadA [Nitrospira sp.]MCW5787591.1 Flp pilus assembly complex ATPase component TadA [Nitrospira sp.]MDR4472701.1 Flp pilus assembly complex ATPase component TadA [Nitrospira sp.]MDR4477156.1 Flp pilus assembly complex ATPase component TadA [Nitrospira sp.]HAP39146.1 pilus assembly protein PilB [Nitrospira sp.]